ncbi:A-kinase anchor protein 14 [Aquarana catesbeiana]|uniref:A-kinase anchor protein 14 n=1 Tax=Aquarana catesbeiana TaxID=8400 RepID=UPI003CC92B9E
MQQTSPVELTCQGIGECAVRLLLVSIVTAVFKHCSLLQTLASDKHTVPDSLLSGKSEDVLQRPEFTFRQLIEHCIISLGVDKMDSEESYIAALKEKARELVETAMKNAQDCFRTLQTAPMDDTDKEQNYTLKNIAWVQCKDFTVDLGKKQIEEYVSTWEFDESWLYCTDFLKKEEMEYSKLFHYRMRWSIPTCRKPVPRATACVYFTIKISKIKPSTLPVEVFFVFESNRLVHRPGQTRFREKWLKDIIESKIIMMDSITF